MRVRQERLIETIKINEIIIKEAHGGSGGLLSIIMYIYRYSVLRLFFICARRTGGFLDPDGMLGPYSWNQDNKRKGSAHGNKNEFSGDLNEPTTVPVKINEKKKINKLQNEKGANF